jgi:hypothetical protein
MHTMQSKKNKDQFNKRKRTENRKEKERSKFTMINQDKK